MTRFTLLLFLFTSALSLLWANDRCLQLLKPTKEASQRFIAKDYPYWYNVATAKKETNCRWIKSLDGHGSIGYFQLTPKFLDPLLSPLFPDYTKEYSKDHFYAFAYYLNTLIKSNPVPSLWIAYQRYNGGDWVLRECKFAKSYNYKACMEACYSLGKRGMVCVWRDKTGVCKQYRHACEINYLYSYLIFKYSQPYKQGSDSRWLFW